MADDGKGKDSLKGGEKESLLRKPTMAQELEHEDKEFLQLADMADNTEIEHLENSLERFDMVSFDATIFDGMLFDNSLPFMVYKIY